MNTTNIKFSIKQMMNIIDNSWVLFKVAIRNVQPKLPKSVDI